ncbi:LAFE_0E06194g1_1 [Lachancea fermentati]|uniref:LAFE_0E06194g1_1 n=1 Tax=Lachancea fermentati TaxID=4955 RepID=A0A1G4MD08_LACFM|nr:LAFE_0E06194g1_1 [Lachancea fermentati]
MSEKSALNVVRFSYFDPFEIFDSIRNELEQRLPFQNLHWKPVNGSLRTISNLQIKLIAETESIKDDLYGEKPLIMFLIVSCTSVDEYRSKVRPLIRQWLPPNSENVELPAKRIILLRCNSEVLDTNLFKSISLLEKLTKDFPASTVIEIKTIYKSQQEKDDFWVGMINRLRASLMDTFQKRLTYLQAQLSGISGSEFDSLSLFQEKILNLYLSFNLHEEASKELDTFRKNLIAHLSEDLPLGDLQVPFKLTESDDDQGQNVIARMMVQNNLSKFRLNKFFFIKQCELLQSSGSFSIKYFHLYSLTRSFLRTIECLFWDSPYLLEFEFYFIEAILDADLFMDQSLNAIIEIRAELKLFQRDRWLNLAYSLTDFRLINKYFPPSTTINQCDLLQNTFCDEETFQQTYLRLTKNVLTSLSKCKAEKQRTVDLLSVEVAILYYQREEYENAIVILQSCYEFYKSSHWSLIGNELLEYFVKCLIKCPDLKFLEISGEKIPVSTLLSNSILNLLTTVKDAKDFWWDFFLRINNKDTGNLVYPLDNLFEIHINHCTTTTKMNTFALEMTVLNNLVPKDVEVSSIQLLLKNHDDEFLTFNTNSVCVKPGENSIVLETTRMTFGIFELVSLEVTVGNTFFCKEFCTLETEDVVEFQPVSDPSGFDVLISPSRLLELTKNRIEILHMNADKVSSFHLDLTIIANKDKSQPSVAFTPDKKKFKTSIDNIETKFIEFFFIHQCNSFTVKQEVTFRLKDDPINEYYQCRSVNIDCRLPVSVSVEDISKSGAFFFKFLISSSSREEPILLHSSSLSSVHEEKYSISRGFETESPLLLRADDEEICLNYYQINTLKEMKFTPNDLFYLKINYNTLKQQMDHLVTSIFLTKGDISISEKIRRYQNIWQTVVLPKLKYDYHLFEQKSVIRLAMSAEMVQDILTALTSQARYDGVLGVIADCLEIIQTGSKVSGLEIEGFSNDLAPSQLIVPVNLPHLQQFFTVEFITETLNHLEIGKPFAFKVQIMNLTDQWDTNENDKRSRTYVFELVNDNEWLINGTRKAALPLKKNEYSIQMIPLKRGYLRYPRVEIFSQKRRVPEVNLLNIHETLLVT